MNDAISCRRLGGSARWEWGVIIAMCMFEEYGIRSMLSRTLKWEEGVWRLLSRAAGLAQGGRNQPNAKQAPKTVVVARASPSSDEYNDAIRLAMQYRYRKVAVNVESPANGRIARATLFAIGR